MTYTVTQEDQDIAADIIRVVVNKIRIGSPVGSEIEDIVARHRIETLERAAREYAAEIAKMAVEINIKAEFIDATVNQLAQAEEAIAAKDADIARLREFRAAIDTLRTNEGESVEFIHDNPEGEPNCAVRVTTDFGENYATFFGDTVEDCLRQALEARQALGASHDA